MALRTYVKEAWEDIEDFQCTVDGARETADCARIYQNDAWEDVWTDAKELFLRTYTTTTGFLTANEKWEDEIWMWAFNDGGYIDIWTEEGEFSDVTVSYTYEGGRLWQASGGHISAGTLYVIGQTSSGSIETISSHAVDTYEEDEAQTNSVEVSGTYKRLGFRMKFSNWQASDDEASVCYLSYITIDGDKYILDESAEFELSFN